MIRAAVWDFDGTLSTLRYGWESVMRPLMREMIGGDNPGEDLAAEIDEYIDQSTGIQTIHQMKWLARRVEIAGYEPLDPWEYKAEYNRRLMRQVEMRKQDLRSGRARPEDYTIRGSQAILSAMKHRGIPLFAASGTDHEDVIAEARALGLDGYFTRIQGAPAGREDCSKEAVIRELLTAEGLRGEELLVLGDGRVEIALAKESGAWAIGVASDEEARAGIHPAKLRRLQTAGADLIIGDYEDLDGILRWMDERGEIHVS